MSLTSELESKDSPVRAFFEARLPNLAPLAAERRALVANLATVKPPTPLDWGTIGTAIDYRVRYFFGRSSWDDLIAAVGASRLTGIRLAGDRNYGIPVRLVEFDPSVGFNEEQKRWGYPIDQFREALESTLSAVPPLKAKLGADNEVALARFCYVLALFEQMYRIGPAPHSPLFGLPAEVELADLLKTCPDVAANDMRAIMDVFYRSPLAALDGGVVLNPTFEGSHDINADADLIVGSQLIEIKTVTDARQARNFKQWVYQLIGYVLLDYSDSYAIDTIGIYFARQGALLSWPLERVLDVLSGGSNGSLPRLRGEFRKALADVSE